MEVPIWYADWEYRCCGRDISIGDQVEWTLFWDCRELFTASQEAPSIRVSDLELDAVLEWVPQEKAAGGVAMMARWGELQLGIIAPRDSVLSAGMVHGRGKVWYQHHVDPIPHSVGTLQAIYRHPMVFRRINERQGVFDHYEEGASISSTADTKNSSGDFRFLVEIGVSP